LAGLGSLWALAGKLGAAGTAGFPGGLLATAAPTAVKKRPQYFTGPWSFLNSGPTQLVTPAGSPAGLPSFSGGGGAGGRAL
jgi:hypothetical protein